MALFNFKSTKYIFFNTISNSTLNIFWCFTSYSYLQSDVICNPLIYRLNDTCCFSRIMNLMSFLRKLTRYCNVPRSSIKRPDLEDFRISPFTALLYCFFCVVYIIFCKSKYFLNRKFHRAIYFFLLVVYFFLTFSKYDPI